MLTIEGNIISSNGQYRGLIEINQENGLIHKISEPTGRADILLNDQYIFPGFIDLHVHAREDSSHSQEYKEDFKTASEASINGGVVMFAEMPNNPIPPVDGKIYNEKKELIKKSLVPIILYAAIGPGTKPFSKNVPYKVFMGKSIGDMYFNSPEELDIVLKEYQGSVVSFHCEDPIIMSEHKEDITHEKRRPPEAEIKAIDVAIMMIEKYNLQGKICHASTIEAIDKIKKAKTRGLNISVEVTPHHLYFDETMFNENLRKKLQVNPPIRQTRKNRLAMIEALRNGDIDYIATDHAPHTIEEKEKGMSGMPHLDTYGTFITWLIKEHNFTLQDIFRVCSYNPARFVNQFLENKYGKVSIGYVGSLTIIDMKKSNKINNLNLKTKCKWSPFENILFPGSSTITIIQGKVYGN